MAAAADGPSTAAARPDLLARLAREVQRRAGSLDVVQAATDLVRQVMPPTADVSVTRVRSRSVVTVAASGRRAAVLDELQRERGHGPSWEAALGGEVVEVVDARTDGRWPGLLARFVRAGVSSALAVPVPAVELASGLTVYASTVGAFTDADRDAAAQCAAQVGLALTALAELQDPWGAAVDHEWAVRSRAVIEQAKGVLMEEHRVDAEQAFRLLAEASIRQDTVLLDVAEQVVRRVGPR